MPSFRTLPHYDVLIIGARCAGAATAMLLARAGLKVLAVDREDEGSDTMSTHALMRGAVMQLERWGLLEGLRAAGTPDIRRTTFHYGTETIPLDIRPAFGVDALIAPRRALLDAHLVAAARAAGAVVRHRTALRKLLRGDGDGDGRVTGAILRGPDGWEYKVSATLTVGADGRRSSVARMVEASLQVASRNRTGCVYAYVIGLPDEGFEWYYAPGFGAGAIPTNAGAHCVFAAAGEATFRQLRQGRRPDALLEALAHRTNPALASRLASAEAVSQPVIFAGAEGHMRDCTGPGWALVGDAGYFKDPITAHGITDALRDAELLATAIVTGGNRALDVYRGQRDALSAGLFRITDRIAACDWTLPELQRLHRALNDTMNQEQDWMAETFAGAPKAA